MIKQDVKRLYHKDDALFHKKHMLDALSQIEEYTNIEYEEFLEHDLYRMELQIIL